jgi:hypothetical protein
MHKTIVGSVFLLLGGCLVELDGDPGYLWCIEAAGANGTRVSSGGNVNILLAGDWVIGCNHLCEPQHEIFQQGEDGDFNMAHPLYPQWQSLRTALTDRATLLCENQVENLESLGAIGFTQPGDVTCALAVGTQMPVLTDSSEIGLPDGYCDDIGSETGAATTGVMTTTGDMTGGGMTGADTTTGSGAVGPEIYGLTAYSQVLSCSTSNAEKKVSCNVDREFIRFLVENPNLLWLDDATLEQVTGGWRFDTCRGDSLMYALGFRRNDKLTKVGGSSVTDYFDAIDVFGQFGSTLFGGNTVSASFYRGSALWTFVANRVNNPNYP